MRALIDDFLDKRLSRRRFLASMAASGFSLAAARSVLDSLTPLLDVEADAAESAAGDRIVEGNGGALLVEQLYAAGVRFFFNCNSSGTFAIFDALVDRPDLHVIQVPYEGQMVAVAQGYTLASGQIAFTMNDSAGFPNTLTNTYNAWRDNTPIIVGSERAVNRLHGGRGTYEDWDDFLAPSASFTRWRWSVERPYRIPELTRRALKIASTPPEGPVALAFPENILSAGDLRGTVVDRDRFMIAPKLSPDPGLVDDAARLLIEARNPVLVVGSEVTRSHGRGDVIALAESLSLPVVQGDTLFDDFPTDHTLFADHASWPLAYPTDVDLVINLGARMPYAEHAIPERARVIHVSIDAESIGKVIPTDVGIVGDVKEAAADLVTAVESRLTKAKLEAIARERLSSVRTHTDMVRAGRARAARALWDSRPLSWERVAGELESLLDEDAINVPEVAHVRWDDGWTWAASHVSELLEKTGLTFTQLAFAQNTSLSQFTFGPGKKSRIGRTTGGALGWGVGAAIGVKLAQPDRQVVALQGDGSFLFAQAEALWTMVRYEVPVIVVVFDNRSYNGPRNRIMYESGRQQDSGKDMTCYLGTPDVDFAKVAAGFGVEGEVVTTPDQVRPAIERAIASTRDGRPYLIDAVVARTGAAADSTWYPKYSVAAARTRKV
jgi:acetolactate synthase-1/2/3 large subunit